MPRSIKSTDDQGRTWVTPYPNSKQRDALSPGPGQVQVRQASRNSRSDKQASPSPPKASALARIPRAVSSPPSSTSVPTLSAKDFPPLSPVQTTSLIPEASPATHAQRPVDPPTIPPVAANQLAPIATTGNQLAVATQDRPAPHIPEGGVAPLSDLLLSQAPAAPVHVTPDPKQTPVSRNPVRPSSYTLALPSLFYMYSTLSQTPGPSTNPAPASPAPSAPLNGQSSLSAAAPPTVASVSPTQTRKRRRTESVDSAQSRLIDLVDLYGYVPSPPPDSPPPPRPTATLFLPSDPDGDDDDMNVNQPQPSSPLTYVTWPPTPAVPPEQPDVSLDQDDTTTPVTLAPTFRQHGETAKIFTSSPWQPWLRLNPAQERHWQRSLVPDPNEPGRILFVAEYARSETSSSSSGDRIAADLSIALRRPEGNLVEVSYPHPVLSSSGARSRSSVWHLVYDLSDEEQAALLNAGVISRDRRTYVFLPADLDTSRPVFLYAIRGLRGSIENLVPHLRQCIYHSTAYRELCDAHRDHPLLDEFITNLRFDKLAMKDSNGQQTQAIRVYARLPTFDPIEQQTAHDNLRTVNFDHQYLGVAKKETYLCAHCQGADHPSGLCPLPSLPGWQGPNPLKTPTTDPDLADLPPPILPAAPQSLLHEPSRGRAQGRGRGRGRGGGRRRGGRGNTRRNENEGDRMHG
ncbi:hypothetical protein K488DRAFT_71960 [Vararia minispora EC-137]|uniref:Uncharacterized protein n=1 Tax=Vararia minispora EC-137 TaxID=1314806 RepID=A0ACB8QGH6_9AGAM|nr:hypothetical protein K488DRAFT_71960 [Vararia minispora EC-137]